MTQAMQPSTTSAAAPFLQLPESDVVDAAEASLSELATALLENIPAVHADVKSEVPPLRARVSEQMTMPDLGILNPFMADQTISDILVNGIEHIFIDRGGKLFDSGLRFKTHEEVLTVAESIMQSMNQPWTSDCPMIDTRLPDGSRVNLVGPPIAIDGISISIRKFPKREVTLDSMVAAGQMSRELAEFLRICVKGQLNIIISGATGAGKTTMLNALSAAVDNEERIVTIEDSAELQLQQPHVVRLEANTAQSEEKLHGRKISMRSLVKNALRMRPNRIIVGESRGPEAFDVLQAMNTGHSGSMTTLHANTPRDALSRLETMVLLAVPNLAIRMVRQQISSSLNLVLQISRNKNGGRHISQVSEVCGLEGDTIIMQDLISYNETPDGKGQFRWNGSGARHPLVTEAARRSEIMKFTQ